MPPQTVCDVFKAFEAREDLELSMSRRPRKPEGHRNNGLSALSTRMVSVWFLLPFAFPLIGVSRGQRICLQRASPGRLARLDEVCDSEDMIQCNPEKCSE